MSHDKLYAAWKNMRSRVAGHDPNRRHRYAGRGISACSAWSEFAPFAEWALANGYAEGLQLDRRNNDGDYEPGNCRWVTNKANSRNRANPLIFSAFGRTQTLAEWAEEYGMNYETLRQRVVVRQLSLDLALTRPLFAKSSKRDRIARKAASGDGNVPQVTN